MAMISCTNCGKQISDKSEKCIHCGFDFKKTQDNICAECGCKLNSNELVCQNCGYPNDNIRITKGKENSKVRVNKKAIVFLVSGLIVIASLVLLGFMIFGLSTSEQSRISEVEKLISRISSVDLHSGDRIADANEAYDELSFKLKLHVSNGDDLKEYTQTYNRLRADEVNDMISNIPDSITVDDYELIQKAMGKYDSLSELQKGYVNDLEKLTEAIDTINNIFVESIIQKIDNIVAVDMETGEKINEIEELYEKVQEEHKSKITNFDKLSSIKNDYDSFVVDYCIDEIDALGKITLDSEEDVNNVKEFYNSLTSSAKSKVTNYSKLLSAESKIAELKEEEEIRKKTLKSGDVIENSDWRITYHSSTLSAKIYPNDTSGAYIYYHTDDDQVYVDMKFTIKNIDTDILSIENCVDSVEVTYKENYTYTSYALFVSEGDDIDKVYSWDGLSALDSTTLHIAVPIPRESQSNGESVFVELTIAGKDKIIKVQ